MNLRRDHFSDMGEIVSIHFYPLGFNCFDSVLTHAGLQASSFVLKN